MGAVLAGKFGNGDERFNALTEAGKNYYAVQNKVNEALGCAFRYTEDQIKAQDEALGTTTAETGATTELTDEKKKLIKEIANLSEEEMRDWIGVDSLKFISLDGLYRAAGEAAGRDPKAPRFCDACFSGEYPIPPSDKLAEGFEMKEAG